MISSIIVDSNEASKSSLKDQLDIIKENDPDKWEHLHISKGELEIDVVINNYVYIEIKNMDDLAARSTIVFLSI